MFVLGLSFVIAVLDQCAKLVVFRTLPGRAHIRVIPGFFNLCYVQNTGAAWGIMSGLNSWLVILSVAMLVVLVVFRRSFVTDALVHRVALGAMVGGIAGNLVDRVRLGFVIDFLDFHIGVHHFPSFNIADTAICVGVGLYLLSQFLSSKRAAGLEGAGV